MTIKTGKETGEEKEMETEAVCKCDGKCDGGTGWKWMSADLGNRIAGHKAGRYWAEVCPDWEGDELPPNPPGISDMTRYMKGGIGHKGSKQVIDYGN